MAKEREELEDLLEKFNARICALEVLDRAEKIVRDLKKPEPDYSTYSQDPEFNVFVELLRRCDIPEEKTDLLALGMTLGATLHKLGFEIKI